MPDKPLPPGGGLLLRVVGLIRVKAQEELLKLRAVRGNPPGAGFLQGQPGALPLRLPPFGLALYKTLGTALVHNEPYRVGDNQYHLAKHLHYYGVMDA